MSARNRVLIVRHPADAFKQVNYVVHALTKLWRERGMVVESTCDIAQSVGPETIVIPHLDVTRTPDEYAAFFARCPVVLNRDVTDISKRSISSNLVQSPGEHDGAVIVKTDRNAGGQPERDKLRRGGIVARTGLRIAKRLPWSITGMLGPMQYHVYDHTSQVPWPVWRNRKLVVEKFLPERDGDQYCLRQYVFLGDREMNTIAYSPDPLVKSRNVTRREILPDVPAELREVRRQLGFDYGKFDYVMREGKAVLFDTNRTPTYNPNSKAGSPSEILQNLAKGIDTYIQHEGAA